MYQNVIVEATEIVDVLQREDNRVLGGSMIIVDNYSGPQHYWLPPICPIML